MNGPANRQSESIVDAVVRMPIRDQIALVQEIAESADWNQMAYVDSLAFDRVLANFATDVDVAAHAEDVRLHGPVERRRYYL